eukprot:scaffold280_cov50-Attheya_sp.AAC.3
MKKFDGGRTMRTNDDVHISVSMCPTFQTILDTPQVQRLAGLKQLGVSEMVYRPVTHNRLQHSLGVAHLAELMARALQRKQPGLKITGKEIICIKLAGLCHDLGHGPFSHVYDGEFRNQVKKRRELEEKCSAESALDDGWKHEDASLMMIDALLNHLGMTIDMDHLDEPLKQIGNGIDAKQLFAEYDLPTKELSKPGNVLTSRDWIFIKECVLGAPLPKAGETIKKSTSTEFIGRPHRDQEFLYDIVANRHSGLDVDKMDYFARDERHAFGSAGNVDNIFIEEAFVAWGDCPDPENCFRCKAHYQQHKGKSTEQRKKIQLDLPNNERQLDLHIRPLMHLMICYPEKSVTAAMSFFITRFRNHSKLYTHKAAKSAEYLICDILALADPFYKISNVDVDDEDGTEPLFFRISEAMKDPKAFVKLKDSIIDVLELTEAENLVLSRRLIKRLRRRDLYKCVVTRSIRPGHGGDVRDSKEPFVHKDDKVLWGMKEEHTIERLVETRGEHQGVVLKQENIIVEKRTIHHGKGDQNPVNFMRFLPKEKLPLLKNDIANLPDAIQVDEETYAAHIPRFFAEYTVRVYCRGSVEEGELLSHVFAQMDNDLKDSPICTEMPYESEDNKSNAGPVQLSQDSIGDFTPYKPSSSQNSSFSDDFIRSGAPGVTPPRKTGHAKRKLLDDLSPQQNKKR